MMLAGEIICGIYAVQGDFALREFFKKNWHSTREDGLLC